CSNCHKPDVDYTGPALQGWAERAPDKEWIYKWIANPAGMVASGEKHAVAVFEKWKPTMMTGFPTLTKEEVDAIMGYVDAYTPPVKDTGTPGGVSAPAEDNS